MGWKFLEENGEKVAEAAKRDEKDMAAALEQRVKSLRLDIDDLEIEFDKGVATVSGLAADDATLEKAILAIGNTAGVSEVEADGFTAGLTDKEKAEYAKKRDEAIAAAKKTASDAKRSEAVAAARATMREQRRGAQASASGSMSKFYTVEKGDTLSKIAKEFYGDASKYPVIFEANTPMLKDADLIYPGQVLRIPQQ